MFCDFFVQLTQEEIEKRQMRRERNKRAAAKCRQRREDVTNQLIVVSRPSFCLSRFSGSLYVTKLHELCTHPVQICLDYTL